MSEVVPGTECLALLGGTWRSATVRRANEDGTYTVRPDKPDMSFMPDWYGVTRLEIAFDDSGRWLRLAPGLADPDGLFGPRAFHQVLERLGAVVAEEAVQGFWEQTVSNLFGEGAGPRLDAERTYQVLRAADGVAKRVEEGIPAGDAWYRMYWNQTRMGGRDPEDLEFLPTPDDMLAALGLADAEDDPAHLAALEALGAVPPAVAAWARRRGAMEALLEAHPNAPEPIPPGSWEVGQRDGARVIRFMDAHQGDFGWAFQYRDGDDDAEVHLEWVDGEDCPHHLVQSPSFPLFVWDLAQTGAAWYVEVAYESAAEFSLTGRGWVRRSRGAEPASG